MAGVPRRCGRGRRCDPLIARLWVVALLALAGCDDPCPLGAHRQVDVDADGRLRRCVLADGTEHGPWQRQDLQGRVVQGGRKSVGVRVGTWTWRDAQTGQTRQRGSYDRQGRQTGRWATWHAGRQLEASGLYRDGVKVGLWERWDSTGHLVERAWWTGGEGHGRVERFHPDGGRSGAGTLVDGLKQGEWSEWRTDGSLARRGPWWGDEPEGVHHSWHPDGSRESRGSFDGGRPVGVWTWWHPGGQLAAEGEYRSGRRWGRWKQWTTEGRALPDRVDVILQDGVGWGEASETPEGGWVYAADGRPTDVLVHEERIRVGFGNRAFLLDGDGAVLTMAEAPVPLAAHAPVAMGDRAAFALDNGDVLVVDPNRAWMLELRGGLASAGIGLLGSTIVYADDTGVRGVSDQRWWRVAVGAGVDRIAAGEGTVVVGLDNKEVVGLTSDGQEEWRRPVFGRLVAAPIVAGGVAVVATDEPALRAIDLSTGTFRWSLPVPGLDAQAWVARSGGSVVVTAAGQTRAVSLQDGVSTSFAPLEGARSAVLAGQTLARVDDRQRLHLSERVVQIPGADAVFWVDDSRVLVRTDASELMLVPVAPGVPQE